MTAPSIDTSHAGLSTFAPPEVCGFTEDWFAEPVVTCNQPATHAIRAVKHPTAEFSACPEHVEWMQRNRPENVLSLRPIPNPAVVGEHLGDWLEGQGYACPSPEHLGVAAIAAFRAAVQENQ